MVKNYGQKIADLTINGTDIALHSNGESTHVGNDSSFDDEGTYLGLRWQCVEFIRRYYYLAHGVNLAQQWSDGDAKDWYDNRTAMKLDEIPADQAQEGDIITFTGGNWGHVAIISGKGDNDSLLMSGQNFYNDQRDVNTVLTPDILSGNTPLPDGSNAPFFFQSILRLR